MRILVADDETMSRTLLAETLTDWGYQVETASDGDAAWAALSRPDPPEVAILDWMMPGPSGPELCQRVRARPAGPPVHLVLLSFRDAPTDVVAGLRAGANDYLTKPFRDDELAARLNVAAQMVAVQRSLAERVHELEQALAQIKQLHGLLPICAWCKKIRDDQNYWQQLEDYLRQHTGAQFSHSICPDCFQRQLQDVRQAAKGTRRQGEGEK
jgi:sigma-B regulation protein RsbU (phosphoserine phosphatase)